MNLKKLAVATAVSLALGGSVVGQARADAFAGAIIDITNFQFTQPGGTLDLTQLNQVSFTDELLNRATLNGTTIVNTAATDPFNMFAPLNPLQACVGGPCPGQDNYTITGAPPPTGTFARSDSILAGQPISGTGFPTGVHAGTVAEVSIGSVSSGNANTHIGLTGQFQFTTDAEIEAGDLGISFDAFAFLQAWTAAGTTVPTSAGGAIEWSFILTDQNGVQIIKWEPGGDDPIGLNILTEPCDLNALASAGASQPFAPVDLVLGPATGASCTGFFSAVTTIDLAADTTYSITIEHNVSGRALQGAVVPEPSTLLLFGLGMLGLGFARRRFSKVC